MARTKAPTQSASAMSVESASVSALLLADTSFLSTEATRMLILRNSGPTICKTWARGRLQSPGITKVTGKIAHSQYRSSKVSLAVQNLVRSLPTSCPAHSTLSIILQARYPSRTSSFTATIGVGYTVLESMPRATMFPKNAKRWRIGRRRKATKPSLVVAKCTLRLLELRSTSLGRPLKEFVR